MSISTSAVSELAISQINLPQELAAGAVMFSFTPQPATFLLPQSLNADRVMFSFNPQDTTFLLPQGLNADPVFFQFGGEQADTGFPGPPKSASQLNLPDFNLPSAWTIDFGDPIIDYAGFSPLRGAFLVVLVNGNFALWLHQSQGVMRGLLLAPKKLEFLHNLGPPFMQSFIP
jgi:hypothetical protein